MLNAVTNFLFFLSLFFSALPSVSCFLRSATIFSASFSFFFLVLSFFLHVFTSPFLLLIDFNAALIVPWLSPFFFGSLNISNVLFDVFSCSATFIRIVLFSLFASSARASGVVLGLLERAVSAIFFFSCALASALTFSASVATPFFSITSTAPNAFSTPAICFLRAPPNIASVSFLFWASSCTCSGAITS